MVEGINKTRIAFHFFASKCGDFALAGSISKYGELGFNIPSSIRD